MRHARHGEAPIKADIGAERMFSAILDFPATRPAIDAGRFVVQGRSWSGWTVVMDLRYADNDPVRLASRDHCAVGDAAGR